EPTGARQAMRTLTSLLADYIDAANAIAQYMDQQAEQVMLATQQKLRRMQHAARALPGVSPVHAVVISMTVTGSIARPLNRVADVAGWVAGGDLTVPELNIQSQDEIGMLAALVNTMLTGLRGLISQIADSGRQATRWAEELRTTTG